MDRLTERTTTGAVPAKARLVFDLPSKDFEVVREIFIRLAAYEDLELTPDEIEAQLANFSAFLCEMTGGKMSKTNYTLDAMLSVANDYQQSVCDECRTEAEASNQR